MSAALRLLRLLHHAPETWKQRLRTGYFVTGRTLFRIPGSLLVASVARRTMPDSYAWLKRRYNAYAAGAALSRRSHDARDPHEPISMDDDSSIAFLRLRYVAAQRSRPKAPEKAGGHA